MADNDQRPPPKDLSHHLSRNARNREPSRMKQFYKYFAIPGIGQLAGGLPNDYYFPFDTLEAKVAQPERWQPTPNKPVRDQDHEVISAVANLDLSSSSSPLHQPQEAITVPHTSRQLNPLQRIDLATALQYGQAQGYPPLYYFVRQFARNHLHPNCPFQGGPEVILTCGNTDGLSKVLTVLTDEWDEHRDWIRDRDTLLVEEYAYPAGFQSAQPRGMGLAPVKIDAEGMLAEGPGGLRDVLESWDLTKGRRPRLMYTVTMGQNPTSVVLSLRRRREIYALCAKYDIIIIEDDPYWYLQFPSSTAHSKPDFGPIDASTPVFATSEPIPEGWKSSGYDFLDSLVPSYVNIDTDGRVLRLDTFSKTVAPGCRLGWITGQPALIERLLRITETSTQQPSGFVQATLAELLLGPNHNGIEGQKPNTSKKGRDQLADCEGWKVDGWVRWLEGLRGDYERRMNEMCRILDEGKFLVKSGRRQSLSAAIATADNDDSEEWSVVERTQLYSFDWPAGGMFIWLKVNFESHPLYSSFAKSKELAVFSRALWLFWTTKPFLVLVSPGLMFSPTDEIRETDGWRYYRLCFAAISQDDLPRTTEGLSKGIAAFWRIKDRKVIEKIISDDEENAPPDMAAVEAAGIARMIGPC